MPIQPSFRAELLTSFVSTVSGVVPVVVHAVDETYEYDPTALVVEDVDGLVGNPVELITPGVAVVGEQVWLTTDDSPPLVLSGIPVLTEVRGLLVYIDSGDPGTSPLVGSTSQRADSTPISFTANGGNYLLTLPGGFVLRI